jgi:DNA sulfur modification protein DndD
MIIKSIAIENFQCYSGDLSTNTFEFKKGLNVIIGDNGSGKSKLYDAFFWVMYDKIFNSSTRDLELTSHVGINLVSDKSKAECELGEKVETKVRLVLEELKAESSYPEEYLLERKFSIKKIKESEDFNDKNIWQLDARSITRIEKKDILEFKPLPSLEYERIVSKLLPNDMKPYLWFQGEQVDSLIDFKKEDSLTEAINVLSDINHYDFLIDVGTKVYGQADKSYRDEMRRVTKSNEAVLEWHNEQDRLEKNIQKDTINLNEIKINLEQAENHKEDLLGKIKDAQDHEVLKSEIRLAKDKLNRQSENLDKVRKGFNSNLFSKKWLLRNASPYVEEFENMLKDYNEKRENLKIDYKIELQREEAKKNRLPENVPNKTYLKSMLEEKQCFLCDRSFEEGDHAYEYISQVLEKAKSNHVRFTDILKNDLRKHFETLYSNAHFLNDNYIKNVDSSIQREVERIGDVEDKKIEALEEYKTIEEKMKHLIATSSVDQDESRTIVSQFRSYDSSKERFKENEIETINRLKENNEALKDILEKLKKSVGSDIDPEIEKKKEILEMFKELTVTTRDLVYEEQIKRIEEEANKHFHLMTEENTSVRGKIILERRGKSYMPKNVDENGMELTSINDSNIILIKLATIMAIVTAKGGTDSHPLISDAPTSKFSDNYTMGFCKTMSTVFNQSIIISYDFFHNKDLRERLLNEVSNLGSVYVIEPSISEEKRMNRTNLSTNLRVLN